MKSLKLLLLLLLPSCAHTVHSLQVEESKRILVENEVQNECAEACKLDRCWMETEDVIFCAVEFSFVSKNKQNYLLSSIVLNLKKHGLNTGLCGRDSFATGMFYAFIGGMAAGFTSALIGGSHQSHHTYTDPTPAGYATTYELNERLSVACQEGITLVEKYALKQ